MTFVDILNWRNVQIILCLDCFNLIVSIEHAVSIYYFISLEDNICDFKLSHYTDFSHFINF